MFEPTAEQRSGLESGKGVEVVDPETSRQYIVLEKAAFDRIWWSLYDASDWTQDEISASFARAMEANGWNEPGMEDYDRYDEAWEERCKSRVAK